MKLREIEDYGFKILNERSKDGSMTIYAKFTETEKAKQNSRIYPRKIMLLPESDGKKSVAKKLTEEEMSRRIYSYFEQAKLGGFVGSLQEFKDRYPKIVDMASKPVEKIEEKKEPKEPIKYKISWSEAQASGFTGTIAEYREKYPDIELILPEPPSKPISETLEEQAQRIFEGLKKANPNSSVTLESVKRMLEKEEEPKREKKIRELAIRRVNAQLGDRNLLFVLATNPSQFSAFFHC